MKKKNGEISIRSSAAEYLTYVASIGEQSDSIEMRYEDENIWLTQKMMAVLYDVALPTINEHIKKIFCDSELEEGATIRKFRIVQTEGSRQVNREVAHYNLQMIVAVGFKVNNERAVQFRKWANRIVKDYTIKGWVMDDERLKYLGRRHSVSDAIHTLITAQDMGLGVSGDFIYGLPGDTATDIINTCKKINSYDLSDCILYTTAYPCPMCLSAIIWANIKKVYYGNTKEDAADIGFRDDFIYDFIEKLEDNKENKRVLNLKELNREEALKGFNKYKEDKDKITY